MDITLDLNRLTYREYRDFIELGGDPVRLLARVVTQWPFTGDPSDPASYEALGLLDLLAIQAQLRDAIQAATAGN